MDLATQASYWEAHCQACRGVDIFNSKHLVVSIDTFAFMPEIWLSGIDESYVRAFADRLRGAGLPAIDSVEDFKRAFLGDGHEQILKALLEERIEHYSIRFLCGDGGGGATVEALFPLEGKKAAPTNSKTFDYYGAEFTTWRA